MWPIVQNKKKTFWLRLVWGQCQSATNKHYQHMGDAICILHSMSFFHNSWVHTCELYSCDRHNDPHQRQWELSYLPNIECDVANSVIFGGKWKTKSFGWDQNVGEKEELRGTPPSMPLQGRVGREWGAAGTVRVPSHQHTSVRRCLNVTVNTVMKAVITIQIVTPVVIALHASSKSEK